MISQIIGKKYGDYYYYKSIVNTGEEIEIFNNIKIPNDLSRKYNGKNIIVTVFADAIQSDNFIPDYTLEDPWYNIKIEKSVENTYGINVKDEDYSIELKFENDAEKHIEISRDFFGSLNKMIPGDTVEENIKIINKTDNETEYFYGIEIPENITATEKELLEKCILTVVKNDTDTIYNDELLNHKNNSMGKLKPGEEANVKFIIRIPEGLNNNFSRLKAKFNWKFSVQPGEKNTENIVEKIINNITNSPKTGDLKFDISLKVFFISAIVLIIVLFLEHRIKKNIK